MILQGNLQVAGVYAGENCVQLKGPEIVHQLYYYLRLLTLCMLFSKKPFPVFLSSAGFSEAHVLLQKPKAGVCDCYQKYAVLSVCWQVFISKFALQILKPAFTILRDENSKCFLLLIRGTHSIKDTLTAVTGAVVPFHHSVLNDGGISNLVLGYAHCGMVAAARWIAKLSTPSLLKAVEQNPDYEVKVWSILYPAAQTISLISLADRCSSESSYAISTWMLSCNNFNNTYMYILLLVSY